MNDGTKQNVIDRTASLRYPVHYYSDRRKEVILVYCNSTRCIKCVTDSANIIFFSDIASEQHFHLSI